ncbi:hypothetical protein AB0M39_03665 [Streptomyces sp. NPDC051907]|uniref:hypothetical protein n=1 Tax=Streptomyces sp. NPDC051907 TaxID=3155284 RepID=UPI0034210DFA
MNNVETGKPVGAAADFASASVPRHLLRGALGFGLIIGTIALVPFAGPAPLLAAPLSLLAFRGCPTCWVIGLAQTISRGRLKRTCTDGVCTLETRGLSDGAAAEDARRARSYSVHSG